MNRFQAAIPKSLALLVILLTSGDDAPWLATGSRTRGIKGESPPKVIRDAFQIFNYLY